MLKPIVQIYSRRNKEQPQSREGPLCGCRLNRSMQHPDSHYKEEDVEYEVPNKDLLQRN